MSVDEKLSCLMDMTDQLQYALEPRDFMAFEKWPGNDMCIECNFVAGLAIGVVEISVLYLFLTTALRTGALKSKRPHMKTFDGDDDVPEGFSAVKCVGMLVGCLGWLYYSVIIATYWNFVSYMLLVCGLALVFPTTFPILWQEPSSLRRDAIFTRRLTLAGWLLGGVAFGLFPNVTLIPSQIQRHLYPSDLVLQPEDPLVLQLKDQFLNQNPDFYSKQFEEQMSIVDIFIYDVIEWKTDYSQWYMVGLLTSAHEVIERKAGDCQGQAATTASLLLALGIEAWAVETPFHWWTMARDNVTGHIVFMNTHGGGNQYGNVLPQPVDLAYTKPPNSCTNCPYIFSHNQQPSLYISPPHRSIPLALTGAHIYVRSGWSWSDVSLSLLGQYSLAFAALVTFYSSYYLADYDLSRILKRGLLGSCLGVFCVFGISFWTSNFYPVTTMHAVAVGSFSLYYLCSQNTNFWL